MEGVQGHCALLDRGAGFCTLRAYDVKAEITLLVVRRQLSVVSRDTVENAVLRWCKTKVMMADPFPIYMRYGQWTTDHGQQQSFARMAGRGPEVSHD